MDSEAKENKNQTVLKSFWTKKNNHSIKYTVCSPYLPENVLSMPQGNYGIFSSFSFPYTCKGRGRIYSRKSRSCGMYNMEYCIRLIDSLCRINFVHFEMLSFGLIFLIESPFPLNLQLFTTCTKKSRGLVLSI